MISTDLADLCCTTHQHRETTADCTPTLALSPAKHFNLWRQKQKCLAFPSLYCSRYNIICMHFSFLFFLFFLTQHIEKSHFSPLFPVCAAAAERFSHMSFSIFLLSVDYLDSCSLFPAKPVLFILFLVSPGTLQNWI